MSAHPFKAGDRIRSVSDRSTDIAEGDEFVVLGVDFGPSGSPLVQFNDKGGDFRHRFAEDYELVAGKKRDYVADHARRTLRKAGLTAKQAKEFVQNVQTQKHSEDVGDEGNLSKYSRALPGGLRNCLAWAFTWGITPQGHDYWQAIHNNISKEENAQA